MSIGVWIGIGEASIGLLTGNPVMIAEGAGRAVRSYAFGVISEPIMEPVKDLVGDFYSDVDWVDVVDNCPLW